MSASKYRLITRSDFDGLVCAVLLKELDLIDPMIKAGDTSLGLDLIFGAVLSCIAALIALAVMMRMFRGTWTMLPFVVYRLVLGVFLLAIAYEWIALPVAA